MQQKNLFKAFIFVLLWFLLSSKLVYAKKVHHHQQHHQHHQQNQYRLRQRHIELKKAPNFNVPPKQYEVQVEEESYFDVIEKPEQFLEVGATQIAPSTKGNIGGKSPAHIKRFKELLTATEDSGGRKKSNNKHLPAFLFNSDITKIQSNARNIEDDAGKHFFYERNIIIEPTLPADKLNTAKQQKGDGIKPVTKEQLRRRMSFRRRLFKQLKGKKLFGPKKHSKRKVKANNPERNLHAVQTTANLNAVSPLMLKNSEEHFQRSKRAVTAKKERIWDYGVIPYEIDHVFSGAHKALFKQAMRHWENFTCIKFVERDPKVHTNYIYFTVKSCGCCSYVGKQGKGRQAISIGRNCEKFGIVVHELGHVIGFWHEHTRTDRDKYIIINKANIIKGQEYNFDVLSAEDVDSLGLPYNYNSIMHYAKNTFSKSAYLDTIQPVGIPPHEQIKIGQRVRLSRGDIAQANLLYKCPACGKTFQENSGQIIAPHYYANNDRNSTNFEYDNITDEFSNEFEKSLEICEWRISATNGERIILQVHKLNLLTSQNCSDDYLEVRDGYWYKSPVIKRICGNVTSETIKSESSRMLLSYVNRNVVKGFRGFIADFEVICGGEIFLNEDRRIDSPNYPLEYMPDKECIWRISVPENHQVALKFQSFELENHDNCIYDYVEVRDGDDENAELIGIFCGYKLPPNIKTNSNRMFIKFVSDGSVQKVGFSALFMQEVDECKFANHGCEQECVNTLGSYECDCHAGYELNANGKTCEAYACGGIKDASIPNGTISSPMYPNLYPLSKECVWELVAPANHAVFLKFDDFDLEGTKFQYTECNYDKLVAYSKLRDGRLKKIGIYCGTELPPVLNSLQNILRVEFISDKSIQHTGFIASYEIDYDECSIDNGGCQHFCRNTFGSYECSCRNGFTLHADRHNCTETKCKFEITNAYGVIYSPNYPDDYPRNIYCFWHFQTVLGHRVQLTFHVFEVENHQECIYDYVAIHDGKSENGSMLGIYCGGREPYSVLASVNEMFMVLKTDAGLQRKGFMAIYSTECGGYLHATNHTQIFYSHPRYGSRPYGKRQYCNWRIQSDPESSVKIKFLQFDIEYSDRCDYDYVEVTEDLLSGYIRNKNHGRFCGNKRPPSITSYSDTLLIRFQSDESTSLRGFAISFLAVEPPDEDLIDDLDSVTPFPGYMKNIYYKPDFIASTLEHDNSDEEDDDYDEFYDDRKPKHRTRLFA